MIRIVILPASAAILFGTLLLVAPRTIETIAHFEGSKRGTDEMVLKNRRVFGLVFAILGVAAFVSAFIP